MAYYFCTIREQLSEYSFDANFLLESADIEKDFNDRCANWRGEGKPDGYFDVYWFDNVSLDMNDSCYSEVSKEEFDVLKKYITVV
jgi:hypothetical protein